MTLVRGSAPEHQPAFEVRSYRSKQELAMRDAVELFSRSRWPEARIVHELVVGRGEARADVAVIGRNHFVAFEIKSAHDSTTRLVSQVCMFRLVAPELWVAIADQHSEDVDVVRYLIPSLGCLTFPTKAHDWTGVPSGAPLVTTEAAQFVPHAESMLRVLWVAELADEARRHLLWQGAASKPPAHDRLVKLMMKLTAAERMRSVCRQLRMRDAMWRADPPLNGETA